MRTAWPTTRPAVTTITALMNGTWPSRPWKAVWKTNTQQEMVYVQDYMGQYNSYLQGANTQIANSNQTLTNLARGQ